jgi:hypothetical protein
MAATCDPITNVPGNARLRTGPRLGSAFPTIVVLETSTSKGESTLESNLFSVFLPYTSSYCTSRTSQIRLGIFCPVYECTNSTDTPVADTVGST